MQWNQAGRGAVYRDLRPEIILHLLDPEDGERVLIRLPRWPFHPPLPPESDKVVLPPELRDWISKLKLKVKNKSKKPPTK